MVKWRVFDQSQDQWSICLSQQDESLFQTYEWGEVKNRDRWQPVRLQNEQGWVLQVLLKRLPMRMGLVWAPGVGAKALTQFSASSAREIQQVLNLKAMLFRMALTCPQSPQSEMLLQEYGFHPARHSVGAPASVLVDLTSPPEQRLQNSSGNWRHNYKRFEKQRFSIVPLTATDGDAILNAIATMENYKKVNVQIERQRVFNTMSAFKNWRIFAIRNSQQELTALRGFLFGTDTAWDWLAASTPEGRKTYASYGLLWHCLNEAQKLGLHTYDLMGIDKVLNPGVASFKKGTGGKEVHYLGEWEWSNIPLARQAYDFLMEIRR